jgi:hypothetical protein
VPGPAYATIGRLARVLRTLADRDGLVALAAGGALAVAAPLVAPHSALLPAPHGAARVVAAVLLAAAFLVGLRFPLPAFYGVIALTVLEGLIRRYVVNDIAVFLAKDFAVLGIYAAVLPRAPREALRRPWWLVTPVGFIVALALVMSARSASISQAIVGLRAYAIYLPLLWVAPLVLRTSRRVTILLVGLMCAVLIEVGLGVLQFVSSKTADVNKMVSGAKLAAFTIAGREYVRPVGTFMQSGSLSAFLGVAALAAFGILVTRSHRRRTTGAALIAMVAIGVAVVICASRTLLGTVIIGLVLFTVLGAWQRRWLWTAIPLVVSACVAAAVVVVPRLYNAANHVASNPPVASHPQVAPKILGTKTQAQLKRLTPVVVRTPTGSSSLWVPPDEQVGIADTIVAYDVNGLPRTVYLPASAKPGMPAVSTVKKGIVRVGLPPFVYPPQGATTAHVGSDLLRRSAALIGNEQGGIWRGRIRPPLVSITHQGVVGHGTGSASLGLEYLNGPTNGPTNVAAESEFAKYASELGLPGLGVFVWLIAAIIVLTFLGLRHARGAEILPAACGFAAALILPLWMLVSYALDTPVIGELYFTLTGLAIALARPRHDQPREVPAA